MKNDSTYNEIDQKTIFHFNSLKNNRSFDKKRIIEIKTLLGKARPLTHKIEIGSTNREEKRQIASNYKILTDLNYFFEKIHDILLSHLQQFAIKKIDMTKVKLI